LIYIVWCIAYQKEKFIMFLAFSKQDATWKLRNIITALKSNPKIHNDFWFLYEDENSRKKNLKGMPTTRQVSKFITTTWIRVESFSIEWTARWFVFYNEEWELIRPSLLLADDLSVVKNSLNKDTVDKQMEFITSELMGWIKWRFIFLFNAVSEYCLSTELEKQFKWQSDWIVDEVKIIEDWKLTWPSKYMWTKKEADDYNKTVEKIYYVESIEQLKSRWEGSFNCNYLNLPEFTIWDPVFNKQKLIEIWEIKPFKIVRITIEDRPIELQIFKEWFDKWYFDYTFCGVDTASGQGWDSDSTSLTWMDHNWSLYATVNSNILNFTVTQKLLSYLHMNYWITYQKNSLIIERNYLWLALIEEIKKKDIVIFKKCYISDTWDKKTNKFTNTVGWNTTQTSKEKLKEWLNMAIEQNKIQFNKQELHEFKWWVMQEKWERIVYEPDNINATHDDTIISKWLALQSFLQYNPKFLDI